MRLILLYLLVIPAMVSAQASDDQKLINLKAARSIMMAQPSATQGMGTRYTIGARSIVPSISVVRNIINNN